MLADEGEPSDPFARYDDSVFIQKFGPSITAQPRALWKLKFISLYKYYKQKYFPELPDNYVVAPKKTTADIFLFHRATAVTSSSSSFIGNPFPSLSSSERDRLDEDGVAEAEVPDEVRRFLAKRYVNGDQEPPSDLDCLAWWRENERYYPVIAKMAKDILPMQPSAVETERVHSGGRVVTNWNQSRMGPQSIAASVKLKMYVRYNSELNLSEDPLQDIPLDDEDTLMG